MGPGTPDLNQGPPGAAREGLAGPGSPGSPGGDDQSSRTRPAAVPNLGWPSCPLQASLDTHPVQRASPGQSPRLTHSAALVLLGSGALGRSVPTGLGLRSGPPSRF